VLALAGITSGAILAVMDNYPEDPDKSGWIYSAFWLSAGMFVALCGIIGTTFYLVPATVLFFFGCWWKSVYLHRHPEERV